MISCQLLSENELSQVGIDNAESGFGALSTEKGRLPLKAMAVRATITGLLSQVTVQQTFVNTYAQVLEATYILPLPSRAAVTHFRMEVNGRVVDGVIAERGAARQAYEQALAAGHRAAIMEEERAEVFTVRVGNLLPGEASTVHLSLSGPLAYADGEATFRFPLVVAPRYIPGMPLANDNVGDGIAADTDLVPDASRISPPVLLPGFPNPIELSLEVELYPLAVLTVELETLIVQLEAAGTHEREASPCGTCFKLSSCTWQAWLRTVRYCNGSRTLCTPLRRTAHRQQSPLPRRPSAVTFGNETGAPEYDRTRRHIAASPAGSVGVPSFQNT